MLNWDNVEKLIQDGYISRKENYLGNLRILNYTPQTQYERHWTRETISCRGLIVDKDNNVVARPFSKFFNYEELQGLKNNLWHLYGIRYKTIWDQPFQTYEKMDGCMCILHYDEESWKISTRGSFESDQAKIATKILNDTYKDWTDSLDPSDNKTYLFEGIFPESRVVVNYGDMRDLVLLACIDKETGLDVAPDDNPFLSAKTHNMTTIEEILSSPQEENKEGYVAVFPNGFRFKYKFEDYKTLHRLVMLASPKYVWEMLKEGKDVNKLLEGIPDEFYIPMMNELTQKFQSLKNKIIKDYNETSHLSNKDFSLSFPHYKYRSGIFTIRNNGNLDEYVWKQVKPTNEAASKQ